MDDKVSFIIEMLSVVGFLDTRAPLYMDLIISFMVSLPFLVGFSILLATQNFFKIHKFTQSLLFFLTLIGLGSFAYFVHYKEGFDRLLQQSTISSEQASIFLLGHIFIVICTVVMWMFTLLYAAEDRKRRALPGVYTASHRKSGRRVFLGILLTSISSIGIYWMFFMA